MERNYDMHRIQTAEAQFSSIVFFFRCTIFHFKRSNFTNTNPSLAKIALRRVQKTRKRSKNNQFSP
jgi:hypothetical protein